MEKYCHFIAIYTLLSRFNIFSCGESFISFTSKMSVFCISLQSVTPQPLAGQLTRDAGVIGRRRGRVGVREYVVLFLWWGVFSWGGVRGEGLSLFSPFHCLSRILNLLLLFTGGGLDLSAAALVAEPFTTVVQLLYVSLSCVSTTISFEDGPARGVIFRFFSFIWLPVIDFHFAPSSSVM